jgi:hypothetical protein
MTGAPKPIEDVEDGDEIEDRGVEIEAAAKAAFEREFAIAVA